MTVKVLVIYPFFAHYRAPVLDELQQRGQHEYFFGGDARRSLDGIRLAEVGTERRFIQMACLHLPGGTMWQKGLISAALWGDFDCYIYLGNAAWPATWLSAAFARVRGRRVLFWTHGWIRQESGVRGWFRTAFYRLAHGLLLYGHRARGIGIAQGLAPDALYVIYNSLDCELQWRLLGALKEQDVVNERNALFQTAEVPVVLAAARLTVTKRFDLLIRAAGILVRSGRDLRLLVIGDGAARTQLEALAVTEGVKAVFIGECYDETELSRLFACANVTVSPGNVGLTCMHSLAYGVPVVTHDDPDEQMPEWEAIVPGVTGTLFRKGSLESLADAIERWTRSPVRDPSTREACIAAVRRHYHPEVQRRLIDQAVAGLPASMSEAEVPAGPPLSGRR
jgi:glycosyltransferase involved in cell wall biosynthesis